MKKKLTFLLLVLFAGLSMNAADITDGYYRIQNASTGKYVECTGRIHAAPNVVDPSAKPGTIMEVASENGKLTVLRSQGVDVCHYMTRALTYVPDLFEYAADQVFGLVGEGELLGSEGLDKLKAYFEQYKSSFSLHVEEVGGGYRLYYQLPSMNAVQRFYLDPDNKAQIDYKLEHTNIDELVNKAIEKTVNQVLKAAGINMTYQGIYNARPDYIEAITYSAQKAYNALAEEGTDLVDPSTGGNAAFYKSVLSNSKNIFYFAREVSVTMVENFLDAIGQTSTFQDLVANIRSNAVFKKLWGAFKIVKPNGKYYLSDSGDEFTLVNEANTVIKNNDAIAIWKLEAAESLTVALDQQFDGKYYTTLYVDFPFTVDGGTAYAVTSEKQVDGTVEKTALSSVAAQVPVLLESDQASVTIVPAASGTKPSVNILKGNDFLINELDIKTTTVNFKGYTVTIEGSVVTFGDFSFDLTNVSQTLWNRYNYLLDRNSGTVNNKFFFGLSADDVAAATQTKTLAADEEKLFFDDYTGAMAANKAYIYEDENYIVEQIEEEEEEETPSITKGFYRIKGVNGGYVNVTGRLTASPNENSPEDKAGTIILVEAENGVVTTLRSQGVDPTDYITRAFRYVPKLLPLIVEKLSLEGSGTGILGTQGEEKLKELIMSFEEDAILRLGGNETDGYYLYVKVPKMDKITQFYNDNKSQIDYKLLNPGLVTTINNVMDKFLEPIGNAYSRLTGNGNGFSPAQFAQMHYQAIDSYNWLTQQGFSITNMPNDIEGDDESTVKFFQEILQDPDMTWYFARETAIGMVQKVINTSVFGSLSENVKEMFGIDIKDMVQTYSGRIIAKLRNMNPGTKYFLSDNNGAFGIINGKNIKHGEIDRWTLEPVEDGLTISFKAETEVDDEGTPVYLTTVYTDFAFEVPAGVTAYTVTGIETETSYQYAHLEKLVESGGVVAAQTPVLLAIEALATEAVLKPTTAKGTSASGNLLRGNDFLINEKNITASINISLGGETMPFTGDEIADVVTTIGGLLEMDAIGTLFDQYSYLLKKNSGTINNKFFFTLSAEDYATAYDKDAKKSNVRVLSWDSEGVVGFWRYAGELNGNKAYLYKDELSASDESSDGVKAIRVSFGGDELDEPTMIDAIDSETVKNNVIYDLNGRKVKNPTRGIYVVDGKKVLIK